MQAEMLTSYMQEAYLTGRSVHGDLSLDFSAFAARVSQVVEKYGLPPSLVSPASSTSSGKGRFLHVPDLYLAAACARRTEPAWSRFADLYRRPIQSLCQWAWRDSSASADAAQDILIDLYLPDRSGECRIGSYDGMSSLNRWLRIIVTNRWLNHKKSGAARSTSLEVLPGPVDTSAFGQIETMFAARRYEPQVILSLSHACQECLTVEERLMVLWRFEQNLQLGEIARLLKVHQSTVTRQMTRAMTRVRSSMIRQLTDRYGLSIEAVQECLDMLIDHMPETFSVLALLNATSGSQDSAKGVL